MNIWPSASDRTEHFRFESGDCLYHDHRGYRVLADWEGPGTIHLIRSDVTFQINGLDQVGVLFPFSFGDFATITAIEEGTFEAVVTRSSEKRDKGKRINEESIIFPEEETWVRENPQIPQELGRLWMCGSVIQSKVPFQVDDTHRLQAVIGGISVHFFQGLETHEGMEVLVNDDFHSKQLIYFTVSDPGDNSELNWSAHNLSAPVLLESQFEDGTNHIGHVASLLNACSFDVQVPTNCIGLRISKTYDQFHGRQCARVWCDDDFQGLWYLPRQNRFQRWANAWFGFEIERTLSERTMRITMDPPGGTPMWSMSEITVVGLFLNPATAEYLDQPSPR